MQGSRAIDYGYCMAGAGKGGEIGLETVDVAAHRGNEGGIQAIL